MTSNETGQPQLTDKQKKRLIASLMVLACLSAFTVDVCIPALTQIAHAFAIETGKTHLIISAYILGFAIAQIPTGFLSEKIGRVNALYCGLLLFTVGGLIIAFSQNFIVLLLGRFIQGIGGSSGSVISRSIIKDISTGKELNRLMALLVSALTVSTLVAPIIGSLLLTSFSWHSVFSVSLLMGLICFILVFFNLPETRPKLIANQNKFKEHWVKFWTDANAITGTIMFTLLFFSYMTFVASFSTIATDQFNQQAQHIGWLFASFVIFYLAGSYMVKIWSKSLNLYHFLNIGCGLLAVSTLLFLTMLINDHWVLAGIVGLIFFLLSMGILFSSVVSLGMSNMATIAGTASGIMGTMQSIGAFSGTALSAILYSGDASSSLQIISISAVILLLFYLRRRKKITSNE